MWYNHGAIRIRDPFPISGELKQSYSYIEMVRCLGTSGLRDIVLERGGLLNYKDTTLALRLPPICGPEEAESIGHELIRRLGEALGWNTRYFSGTLVLWGQGRANRGRYPTGKAGVIKQGFTVFLEPR